MTDVDRLPGSGTRGVVVQENVSVVSSGSDQCSACCTGSLIVDDVWTAVDRAVVRTIWLQGIVGGVLEVERVRRDPIVCRTVAVLRAIW